MMLVSPTASQTFDFADSIDAIVTSRDVAGGQRCVWQDSLVVGLAGGETRVSTQIFGPHQE